VNKFEFNVKIFLETSLYSSKFAQDRVKLPFFKPIYPFIGAVRKRRLQSGVGGSSADNEGFFKVRYEKKLHCHLQ